MALGQIFGHFYRFDSKIGNYSTESIKMNAINLEDLEGTLIIFRVNSNEAAEYLNSMFTEEFVENVGASIMVLNDSMISGIDVIDITESEKFRLRALDEELEKKMTKKESSEKKMRRMIRETKEEDVVEEEINEYEIDEIQKVIDEFANKNNNGI